jgi:hypothetical protein
MTKRGQVSFRPLLQMRPDPFVSASIGEIGSLK